jgi:hypothetical protein
MLKQRISNEHLQKFGNFEQKSTITNKNRRLKEKKQKTVR